MQENLFKDFKEFYYIYFQCGQQTTIFAIKQFLAIGKYSYWTVAFHKNSLQHPRNYTHSSIIAWQAHSHVTIIILWSSPLIYFCPYLTSCILEYVESSRLRGAQLSSAQHTHTGTDLRDHVLQDEVSSAVISPQITVSPSSCASLFHSFPPSFSRCTRPYGGSENSNRGKSGSAAAARACIKGVCVRVWACAR